MIRTFTCTFVLMMVQIIHAGSIKISGKSQPNFNTTKQLPAFTLQLLHTAPAPMVLASAATAFEGGTVLQTSSGLHLLTTDVTRGIVNTSLVYYHAALGDNSTFTFVRTLATASGLPNDPKGSLWVSLTKHYLPLYHVFAFVFVLSARFRCTQKRIYTLLSLSLSLSLSL